MCVSVSMYMPIPYVQAVILIAQPSIAMVCQRCDYLATMYVEHIDCVKRVMYNALPDLEEL